MEALTRSRIPVLRLALLGLAAMAQAQNFSYAYQTSAASGNSIQFTISFTPTARGSAAGDLTISIAGGSALDLPLSGARLSAILTYTATLNSGPSALTLGGTLTPPSTNVGASTSVAVSNVSAAMVSRFNFGNSGRCRLAGAEPRLRPAATGA